MIRKTVILFLIVLCSWSCKKSHSPTLPSTPPVHPVADTTLHHIVSKLNGPHSWTKHVELTDLITNKLDTSYNIYFSDVVYVLDDNTVTFSDITGIFAKDTFKLTYFDTVHKIVEFQFLHCTYSDTSTSLELDRSWVSSDGFYHSEYYHSP
jgi:hypothetical protein